MGALWNALAVGLLLLGINKQLDLQTALTELGKILAARQGWYEHRQRVQIDFIIGVVLVGGLADRLGPPARRAEPSPPRARPGRHRVPLLLRRDSRVVVSPRRPPPGRRSGRAQDQLDHGARRNCAGRNWAPTASGGPSSALRVRALSPRRPSAREHREDGVDADRRHEQDAPIPVERHQAGEVGRRRRVVDEKGANRASVQAVERLPPTLASRPARSESKARPHSRLAATPVPTSSAPNRIRTTSRGSSSRARPVPVSSTARDQDQQACLDGGGHGALGSRKIWSPRPRRQPESRRHDARKLRLNRIRRSKIRSGATVPAGPISSGGSVRGCPSARHRPAPRALRAEPRARRC